MKSIWLGLLWIALGTPAFAINYVWYMELPVTEDKDSISVTVNPMPFFPVRLLSDERFALDRGVYRGVVDGPLRETAYFLKTLERNREAVLPYKRSHTYFDFPVELNIRDERGKLLHEKKYRIQLGLSKEKDKAFLECEQVSKKHRYEFSIAALDQDDQYREYLKQFLMPFGKLSFPKPSGAFSVELNYRLPEKLPNQGPVSIQSLFKSELLWADNPDILLTRIPAGVTWCEPKDGGLVQSKSDWVRHYSEAILAYAGVVEAFQGDMPHEELIPKIESYVSLVPSDKNGLMLLRNSYYKNHLDEQAADLIRRFRPIFATIGGNDQISAEVEDSIERYRNRLLGKRAFFDRTRRVKIDILSHADGDLVTGNNELMFRIERQKAPLLVVEAYLDDELIASFDKEQESYRARFTTEGSFDTRELKIQAWFEDETWQKKEIRLETMDVDAQDRIGLVPVQAFVFRSGSGKRKPLSGADFKITENKKKKETAFFRKSTAPLRVAVLIDTSLSMNGEKMRRTRYAVKTFLSKLGADDASAVYTFDSKVVRLTPFTHDHQSVTSKLMTASAHGATSLLDAMHIAEDALTGQNGTKVMIVISDGKDTASNLNEMAILKRLPKSQALVYAISLTPPDPDKEDLAGQHFLSEAARLSGCVHTHLESGQVKRLDGIFDRIYEDLKNLYHIAYYSDNPMTDKSDLRIKVSGAKVRWRAVQQEL